MAVLVFAASTGQSHAQAVEFVENLAERMIRPESRVIARELMQEGARSLDQRILFRESEEAAKLVAGKSIAVSEDALLNRFNRLQGVDDSLRAEFPHSRCPKNGLLSSWAKGSRWCFAAIQKKA